MAEDDDDAPPPLPPPRAESLANAAAEPAPITRSEWPQQPLPMIPIEEHEDDDGSIADSETDVESCNSSNEDDNERVSMDENEHRDNKATNVSTNSIPEPQGAAAVGSPTNGEPEDLSTTER